MLEAPNKNYTVIHVGCIVVKLKKNCIVRFFTKFCKNKQYSTFWKHDKNWTYTRRSKEVPNVYQTFKARPGRSFHSTKDLFQRIWSYLLKKSLTENFIFCPVFNVLCTLDCTCLMYMSCFQRVNILLHCVKNSVFGVILVSIFPAFSRIPTGYGEIRSQQHFSFTTFFMFTPQQFNLNQHHM